MNKRKIASILLCVCMLISACIIVPQAEIANEKVNIYRAIIAPKIDGKIDRNEYGKAIVSYKAGDDNDGVILENDEYGDPRLTIRIENGTDKTLRADVTDFFVNTYALWPQVYIPVEDAESGVTFYGDALYINSFSHEGAVVQGTVLSMEFSSSD